MSKEAIIRPHHPYELPEIIAVPVDNGFPLFLQWVAQETQMPENEVH
jgi:periplasmic divalent cation tolerance protein